MTHLTLNFLGQFHAAYDDRPLNGFESNKIRALLAYLAMEADRPHPRTQLATLLWPDYQEESARGSLRHALHQLRQTLAVATGSNGEAPPWLLTSRTMIQFNGATPYTLDVQTFTTLLHQCASHSHAQLAHCEACLNRLQQAVASYRGDFLAGLAINDSIPFEEWRRLKQETLHLQALAALEQLATAYEVRENHELAHTYALRQLELEPWREEAHRRIMRSLVHSGQRSAALVQFNACRRILAAEFASEPDATTMALYTQIWEDTFPVTSTQLVATSETTATAQPPRSPTSVTTSALAPLPAPLTTFVGRKVELAAILQQLRDPAVRLLTLTGAGGMGKTRLALEVAHLLSVAHTTGSSRHPSVITAVEDRPHFPDGIVFVELAPLRASSEIVAAIITALGVNVQERNPHSYLLRFLHDKRLLLILDNCEHLAGVADLIVELLQRAPALRILATSRARLKMKGEQIYPVQGMGYSLDLTLATACEASAVHLFTQCVRRVQPTFTLTETNLPAVLRICQLVDGMPLGLELAATWADLLPLATIAQEIEQNLDFLATEWHNTPERQRSLGAVFNWSWQMLSAEEQQIFRRLAIFRGGFTREAAEQVADASWRGLISLVHKSLLRPPTLNENQQGHYTIQELLRQFVGRHLAAAGDQDTTEARHSQYYLSFVHGRERRLLRNEPRSAAAEIQAQLDNIRQAWLWAVHNQQTTLLDQSAVGLWQYYSMIGPLQEGESVFAQASEALQAVLRQPKVDAATARLRQSILSKLSAIHAFFLVMVGKYEEAATLAQRAVDLGRANERAEGLIIGKVVKGQIAQLTGNYEELYGEMTEVLAQVAHQQQQGYSSEALYEAEIIAHLWLGGTIVQHDQLPQARQQLMQGLQICQRLGKRRAEMVFLNNLANIDRHRFDCVTASAEYEQALHIANEIGYHWGASRVQLELGQVKLRQGYYSHAQDLLITALPILRTMGELPRLGVALSLLGRLSIHLGNYPKAAAWLTEFSQITKGVDAPETTLNGLMQHSLLAYLADDAANALILINQAIALAQRRSMQIYQADVLILAGHIHFRLGQMAAAGDAYRQAIVVLETIGNIDSIHEPRAGLLQIALAAGELLEARRQVELLLQTMAAQPQLGSIEPFYSYWIVYRALLWLSDPRAQSWLEAAYNHLQACAAQITDPTERCYFLENITSHCSLLSAYLASKP